MVKYVTVDVSGCDIRVYDDAGRFMANISRPGLKSAQSMGTQVVADDGSNVTVYECADGSPRWVSNRAKRG